MINRLPANTHITSIFREIRRYQKSIKLLLNRIVFFRLIKKIILEVPDYFFADKNRIIILKQIARGFIRNY
jgi:histone H3/H4